MTEPKPVEAGRGEHHVYPILVAGPDQEPLTANVHYLGLDAASWFLNKQDGWFSEWTASGTLEIAVAGGIESYQAALGTFELKGGSKFSPVFDRAVLPDRNFRGGSIKIGISLVAIRKDTALTGMLKSAASASLGIVAGMVETASLAGPQQMLASAGGSLIAGVTKILSDQAPGREPLFTGEGIEVTVQPQQLLGPVQFLLFHRGTLLEDKQLSVRVQGGSQVPFYKDQPLLDGTWVLMRLRRSKLYSGIRDWFKAERDLRARVSNLVDDFTSGVTDVAAARQQLLPSSSGSSTLFDEYIGLRRIIQSDGVISDSEAKSRVKDLVQVFAQARSVIGQPKTVALGAPKAISSAAPLPEGPQDDFVSRELLAFDSARISQRPVLPAEEAVAPTPKGVPPVLETRFRPAPASSET